MDALYALNRLDEADALIRSTTAEGGWRLTRRGMQGLVLARRGDRAAAAEVADHLAALDEPYVFEEGAYWAARIQATLGHDDEAIALLRRAFAEGQGAAAWYGIHLTRDFDRLRTNADFQSLVRPRRAPLPLSRR